MEASDIRRSKKTFNVLCKTLIEQLLALYPDQPTLRLVLSELARVSSNKKEDHVGCVRYFKTMNQPTKIADPKSGEPVLVGELIMEKDPRLFAEDCGVKVPELDALDMRGKWPSLTAINKEMVWDYLRRMAECSAKVVVGMSVTKQKIEEAMKDENVKEAMKKFSETKK